MLEVAVDVLVGTLPILVGYSVVCCFGGVSSASGSDVRFRPPAWVFMVAWPVLYLMMGGSWVLCVQGGRSDRYVADICFALSTILICAWIPMYKWSKTAGVWVLVAAIAATLCAWLVAFSKSLPSGLLLVPTISWLQFALLMNAVEVQAGTG